MAPKHFDNFQPHGGSPQRQSAPSQSKQDEGVQPGDQIGKYYKVEHIIGQGGMGRVVRAKHTLTDQTVAIKTLSPHLAKDPGLRERFLQEARALAGMDHPNIMTLHNFLEQEGQSFLVMQYIDGQDLDMLYRRSGGLQPKTVVPIIFQALQGLQYAHTKQIIHRDLKPANILVSRDGRIKLTDFGIARISGELRLTVAGAQVGTVYYMAPEQIQGTPANERTDIYAMGISMYESLTGRLPFTGDDYTVRKGHVEQAPPDPRQFRTDIPASLVHVLMTALSKNPMERYYSVEAFCQALEQTGLVGSTSQLQPCGICRALNPEGEGFTCQSCRKTGLCLSHRSANPHQCDACAQKPRDNQTHEDINTVQSILYGQRDGHAFDVIHTDEYGTLSQSQLAQQNNPETQTQKLPAFSPNALSAYPGPAATRTGEVQSFRPPGQNETQPAILRHPSGGYPSHTGHPRQLKGPQPPVQITGLPPNSGTAMGPIMASRRISTASPMTPSQFQMLKERTSTEHSALDPDLDVSVRNSTPIRANNKPSLIRTETKITPDGSEMVLIPEGKFWYGSQENEPHAFPPREVKLDAYYIDRHPVTNERYLKFILETGYPAPSHWQDPAKHDGLYFPAKDRKLPAIRIRYEDALAYCSWANKRLPTEAEWEQAARWNDGRLYPWGNEWQEGLANLGTHTTTPVHSFPKGQSPYGVQDMLGNVWEWVSDWFAEDPNMPIAEHNPKGPSQGKYRVVRGGSHVEAPRSIRVTTRGFRPPHLPGTALGFRCAYTPGNKHG